jgi:ABC-2 type transport system ATP-binding protein
MLVAGPPLPEAGVAMSMIELSNVSRWYGNVVAVNDVTMTIGPGVTGLLGPNGAGKTTLLAMMAGFLAPSAGSVTLDGSDVWRNIEIYRTLGLVPEREASFGYLTGRQFVRANAELHKLPEPGAAAERALGIVELLEPAGRAIGTYSKGMRQRVKLAAALVHDPAVLLLDEPFNGVDPRQRMHLMQLLTRMGEEGRTVLFSSHILEEVEQIARHIEVVVAGRHAASGDFGAIRRLMTDRPNQYAIRSSDDRRLAVALMALPSVAGVGLTARRGVEVQVTDFGDFSVALPVLAQQEGISLREVTPTDESLESVFTYLVSS